MLQYSAEVNPRAPTSDFISAEPDLHTGYEMGLRFLLEKNPVNKGAAHSLKISGLVEHGNFRYVLQSG